MIILKYLRRNIFRTFLITFLILFSIFFAQQLIVAFTQVSRGNIPVDFVFKYIFLNMPTMLQYFLPFAFFLGVLFTFIRMHNNQEMAAMYACGLPYRKVLTTLMIPTTLVAILCLLNSFWVAPHLQSESRNKVQYFKTNPTFDLISSGSFNTIPNTNYVLFVNSIDKNTAEGIYIFDFQTNNIINFIMSAKGQIKVENDQRLIVLSNGTIFSKDLSDNFYENIERILPELKAQNSTCASNCEEQFMESRFLTLNLAENNLIFNAKDYDFNKIRKLLPSNLSDIHKINFKELVLRIGIVQKESNLEAFKFKTINQLLTVEQKDKSLAYIELLIRIMNALSVYCFAIFGFVFGRVNHRKGKSSNIVFSTSLYFIYILILNSLSSVINKGKVIDSTFYLFIVVNIIYACLVYILVSERPFIRRNPLTSSIRKFFGG